MKLNLWCLGFIISFIFISPVGAEEASFDSEMGRQGDGVTGRLRDFTPSETSPRPPVPQSPNSPSLVNSKQHGLIAQGVTRVTGVEVIQTESGLELVLETVAGSERLVPLILPEGNDLVIDILDATLAFAIRNGVEKFNPAEGITKITVNKVDESSIRVRITGENQTPSAEVVPGRDNLVLSITPEKPTTGQTPDEEIEVIATGEGEDDGYNVDNASTATKTDTPLRDIPQSIQIVPQQVIEDQGIINISDATRNVSGVNVRSGFAGVNSNYNIRGFDTFRTLRNGFAFDTIDPNPSNIERIEILKGPASVLYGQFEPGGIINFVTKQPLSEPYYLGEFTVGSYEFYQPSIDFSAPLTSDKNLLYRLTAAYETADSFVDFVDRENIQVAPTLTYRIGDSTNLTFSYEYLKTNRTFYDGLPIDPIVFDLPRERFVGEPSNTYENETQYINLTAEHQFNENWQLRSGFALQLSDLPESLAFRPDTVEPDGRTLNRFVQIDEVAQTENYVLQTELIGKFNTGKIEHQLLFGFEWQNNNFEFRTLYAGTTSLDLFNPIYGAPVPTVFEGSFSSSRGSLESDNIGLYLQDQITLLDNLKLLIGGRYDFSDRTNTFQSIDIDGETLLDDETEDSFYNEAFSPRVGIVYQPLEPISLYASYSRSFVPTDARSSTGEVFEPTRGTQYEVGLKTDLFDEKLSATVAAYEITKTNELRTDPENPDFSIAIGEVTSRGIEFDFAGEPLPGWNIIASLFFNDAFISVGDESNPEGETLINAPGSGASLWATYQLQRGDLRGLGFGAGIFFTGDREMTIPNTFVLPSYVTADATIFYERDNWRVGLNFKNIFDKTYYSYQGVGLQVEDPFAVVGSISYEF